MLRLKLDRGRSAITMCLLTPRYEGLSKMTADRLTSEKPQVTRSGRETEKFFRPRRSQPLKIDGKFGCIEIVAYHFEGGVSLGQRSVGQIRQLSGPFRRPDYHGRQPAFVFSAQPTIRRPLHFLNCCLSPQHAAAAIGQWPATKMHQVDLARLCFHQVGVTCPLQREVWSMS